MSDQTKLDRSHLPVRNIQRQGFVTYDAKDPETKFPPIRDLRPPEGAPNVLIILIDDAGFGSSSAFGGACQTPNAEKLAAAGLKYTRFHTTALCSRSRQALLTGRNHHSCRMGCITEAATGAPGYSSVLPNTISPLARLPIGTPGARNRTRQRGGGVVSSRSPGESLRRHVRTGNRGARNDAVLLRHHAAVSALPAPLDATRSGDTFVAVWSLKDIVAPQSVSDYS